MYWTSTDLERESYTLYDLFLLYEETVDKEEYPEFGGWLWDMERSAVLYRHEGRRSMKVSGDTRYFFELNLIEQAVIARALIDAGIEGDDYERAINSRVCDLEDTIGKVV